MLASRLFAALVILTSSPLIYSQPAVPQELQNIAHLSANGWVEVPQDILAISLTTSRDGLEAATVQTQLKQALDVALAQARQSTEPGLMDVRTGNFSLYPRFGKDGKTNGWQGSMELVLEGRDFLRITSTAGKIQTLTVGQVSFSLSREGRAKVETEAQAMAIDRFKVKALEVSKGFGFSGFSLREITVDSNDQGRTPQPRMLSMQAKSMVSESPIPVEAGKNAVSVTVSGTIKMQR